MILAYLFRCLIKWFKLLRILSHGDLFALGCMIGPFLCWPTPEGMALTGPGLRHLDLF